MQGSRSPRSVSSWACRCPIHIIQVPCQDRVRPGSWQMVKGWVAEIWTRNDRFFRSCPKWSMLLYTTSFLISKFRDAIWARGFWRYGVGGDTVLQAQRISDCRSYTATRVGTSVWGFAFGGAIWFRWVNSFGNSIDQWKKNWNGGLSIHEQQPFSYENQNTIVLTHPQCFSFVKIKFRVVLLAWVQAKCKGYGARKNKW